MKLKEYRDGASEHSIQVQIINYITMLGSNNIFAISIPNAGKRSLRAGRWMKSEGLYPGAPDICVLLPKGRCIWMETKTARGRQSAHQKSFEERCRQLGHMYVLVRSVEDVTTILKFVGALK